MRRRRRSSEPALPYDAALEAVDTMERRTVTATVTCDFTPRDIVEWSVPPDLLAKLKHAKDVYEDLKNVAQMGYVPTMYEPTIQVSGVKFRLHADTKGSPYMTPADGLWLPQEDAPAGSRITSALLHIYELHCRFNQVRKVVRWFNFHGTLGATKFYFPAMASLLPANHPLHKAGGEIYREPSRPVAEIAPDAREAMTTIAMGLMTHEVEGKAKKDVLVAVYTEQNRMSQSFALV